MDSLEVASRKPAIWVRVVGILVGLGMLFGAVFAFQLATGTRSGEGGELVASPRPIIPERLDGFPIARDPEAAAFLAEAYRRGGVPVTRAEAALVGAGSTKGRLSAAAVSDAADPASRRFRADVLLGAAAGYGVEAAQFSSRVREGFAVFGLAVPDGRLWVWFFRDAFAQLFVPDAIGDRAEEMLDAVLSAMRGPGSRAQA